MTIAELHGKLSSSSPESINDRMEDLLTSDVFGTMKYAGLNCGFLDWLHSAEPAYASGLPPVRDLIPAENLDRLRFAFWPKLPNGREPDVILLFSYARRAVLVVVEAKYRSGMSDIELTTELDQFAVTGNQVVDQVKGIDDATACHAEHWFHGSDLAGDIAKVHLLVTAHSVMPDLIYADALKLLTPPWPTNAYWLSWTTLAQLLREPSDKTDMGKVAMICDLRDLLERKRLIPYRGFDEQPTALQDEDG